MSFYVTTPIYYVNANPHLGHAYTTIAADVASRHMRQRGDDVFFLTGTDEHGSKVARSAAAAGLSPKEFCDQVSAVFRQLTNDLRATNDFFIRTSDPEHEAFVQGFVERMRTSGDVYEDTYSGLYCTACEAFYTDDDLVDGMCPIHGTPPEWVEEKNWFFRLSAYEDRLRALYDERPEFVLPRARYNEARAFIEGGLKEHLPVASLDRVGRARALGTRPGHLRLDRRAHQLHVGAHLRAARRGPGRVPRARARPTRSRLATGRCP